MQQTEEWSNKNDAFLEKPSLGTLNANIVEKTNNLEVFGSKKTK